MTNELDEPFRLTRLRAAAAMSVGFLTLFIPQQTRPEYFPLNDPSMGLAYLQVICGAALNGKVVVYVDSGRGFNESETICWPVAASPRTHTYTFPLADLPVRSLRFDPLERGPGVLHVLACQIVNRKGEILRKFNSHDFSDLHQTLIEGDGPSWTFVIPPGADDPSAVLPLTFEFRPDGMVERASRRAAYSWMYVAFMVWLALGAIYLAVSRPLGVRAAIMPLIFVGVIAASASLAANRGQIVHAFQLVLNN